MSLFGLLILGLIILLLPPPWLILLLSPQICPEAVYFVETNEPVVALTIDDGPDQSSSHTTDQILKILAANQVRATFFLISNKVETQKEVVTQIVNEGHEIGNHFTKDEPSILLKNKFESDLLQAQGVLSEFANLNWLRPGGGWCNSQMVAIAQKNNYKLALGSVWPYDTNIPSSRFAAWFILHNVRPGSIIVLHDDGKRGERTVATLTKILPELRDRGYRIFTLSELTQKQQ